MRGIDVYKEWRRESREDATRFHKERPAAYVAYFTAVDDILDDMRVWAIHSMAPEFRPKIGDRFMAVNRAHAMMVLLASGKVVDRIEDMRPLLNHLSTFGTADTSDYVKANTVAGELLGLISRINDSWVELMKEARIELGNDAPPSFITRVGRHLARWRRANRKTVADQTTRPSG